MRININVVRLLIELTEPLRCSASGSEVCLDLGVSSVAVLEFSLVLLDGLNLLALDEIALATET